MRARARAFSYTFPQTLVRYSQGKKNTSLSLSLSAERPGGSGENVRANQHTSINPP